MTEEQIEKEALKFAEPFLDDKESQAAYHAWKAGYNFRDKLSGWISVDERLPEIGVIVQAWRNGLIKAKIMSVDEKYGVVWLFEGEYRGTYNAPSHWQPIIAPPSVPA